MELRTAAQIEAVELAGLIEVEQDAHLGALLAIERDQAHGAALVEDRAQETAQRAAVLLRQIDQLAVQALDLSGPDNLRQAHRNQEREPRPAQGLEGRVRG